MSSRSIHQNLRARGRAPSLRRGVIVSQLVSYGLLVVGALICLTPFVWLLRSSLMEQRQMLIFPPEWIPKPLAWQNYTQGLTALPFGRYLANTLIIEVFVVIGATLTSVLAAYSFARLRWRHRDVVFGVLLTGMMLPYAVTLIPTFIGWRELHALGTFLPLTVPAWFGGGPFNIFLLRQFFLTIPRELDEAAYLDGATPLQVVWHIILPLSRPALAVVAIFAFIAVWNDFLAPLIYLSDERQFTLALGLATFKTGYALKWGYLMAASAAVVAPIVALFFLAQRYFIEGIVTTGLKG